MIRQISEKLVYGELNLKGKLYKVVSIPYANENFEMQIIIPANKNQKLKLLEDELQLLVAKDIESVSNDAEKFNLFKVVKNESSFNYIEDVSIRFDVFFSDFFLTFSRLLRMPTFKIRHKFNAADSFNQLGVEKVFTPVAELDRMVTGGPIGVGKILHEVQIAQLKLPSQVYIWVKFTKAEIYLDLWAKTCGRNDVKRTSNKSAI